MAMRSTASIGEKTAAKTNANRAKNADAEAMMVARFALLAPPNLIEVTTFEICRVFSRWFLEDIFWSFDSRFSNAFCCLRSARSLLGCTEGLADFNDALVGFSDA
jgi:hypothetical protein